MNTNRIIKVASHDAVLTERANLISEVKRLNRRIDDAAGGSHFIYSCNGVNDSQVISYIINNSAGDLTMFVSGEVGFPETFTLNIAEGRFVRLVFIDAKFPHINGNDYFMTISGPGRLLLSDLSVGGTGQGIHVESAGSVSLRNCNLAFTSNGVIFDKAGLLTIIDSSISSKKEAAVCQYDNGFAFIQNTTLAGGNTTVVSTAGKMNIINCHLIGTTAPILTVTSGIVRVTESLLISSKVAYISGATSSLYISGCYMVGETDVIDMEGGCTVCFENSYLAGNYDVIVIQSTGNTSTLTILGSVVVANSTELYCINSLADGVVRIGNSYISADGDLTISCGTDARLVIDCSVVSSNGTTIKTADDATVMIVNSTIIGMSHCVYIDSGTLLIINGSNLTGSGYGVYTKSTGNRGFITNSYMETNATTCHIDADSTLLIDGCHLTGKGLIITAKGTITINNCNIVSTSGNKAITSAGVTNIINTAISATATSSDTVVSSTSLSKISILQCYIQANRNFIGCSGTSLITNSYIYISSNASDVYAVQVQGGYINITSTYIMVSSTYTSIGNSTCVSTLPTHSNKLVNIYGCILRAVKSIGAKNVSAYGFACRAMNAGTYLSITIYACYFPSEVAYHRTGSIYISKIPLYCNICGNLSTDSSFFVGSSISYATSSNGMYFPRYANTFAYSGQMVE